MTKSFLYEGLKAQFKELAEKGLKGGEIMETLGITSRQARKLHYDLMNAGEFQNRKLEFTHLGELEVAQKGNIFITAQRLDSLGLSEVFRSGAKLKVERVGNSLHIDVVSSPSATGSDSSQAEKPIAAPKRRGFFKFNFGQQDS